MLSGGSGQEFFGQLRNRLQCQADVFGQHGARFVGIASQGSLQQSFVFRMNVAGDGAVMQRQAPVSFRLMVKDGEEMLGPAGRAGGNEYFMEDAVPFFPFLADIAIGKPCFCFRKMMKGAQQVGLPSIAAKGDRLTQGFTFEHDSRLGYIGEIAHRYGCDAEAALPLADDQRIRNQQGQGFAQGTGTDAIVVFEMLDAQFAAWGEPTFDDVAAQCPIGGFHQGLGFRRG